MVETLKKRYEEGRITLAMLKIYLKKGIITQEEYEYIISGKKKEAKPVVEVPKIEVEEEPTEEPVEEQTEEPVQEEPVEQGLIQEEEI